MGKPVKGRVRLNTWRGGLVLLGVGGLLLVSGCHGHGHYTYHGGHHGYHSYHGHGYSGDADLFAGLAVLFFALWALNG